MINVSMVDDNVNVQAVGNSEQIAFECCAIIQGLWECFPDPDQRDLFRACVSLAVTDPAAPMFDNIGGDQ